MLEIKMKRSKNSILLSEEEIRKLVSSMGIILNKEIYNSLLKSINIQKSIFDIAYFVEILEGKAIDIARYNVFYNTIKFAKDHLYIKCNLYTNEELEKADILISYKDINILSIKITKELIKIELVRCPLTFENLLNYFKTVKQNEAMNKLLSLGQEGLNDINNFYQEYKKYMNLGDNTSFCEINVVDLINEL